VKKGKKRAVNLKKDFKMMKKRKRLDQRREKVGGGPGKLTWLGGNSRGVWKKFVVKDAF